MVPDLFEDTGKKTQKLYSCKPKCQHSFPILCLDFFTEKYHRIYHTALYIEANQRLNLSGNMELVGAPGGRRQ